uniref:Uncharacterized protein n=1 Tax=Vitis vinifera TaxID=29760 RepID=A5AZE4_VITVI|nr:hypothetical protein VITISV_012969 [Vitis vinifera]
MLLGWLLLSQGILTLVLALSLLPGLLNADNGEAPSMKSGCVAPRFLILTFLSHGGELAVVARLPTVFFRWLGAIQNYLPLPYQMNGFGKVWPSSPVTESASFPQTVLMLRPRVPSDPRGGRAIITYGRLTEIVGGAAAPLKSLSFPLVCFCLPQQVILSSTAPLVSKDGVSDHQHGRCHAHAADFPGVGKRGPPLISSATWYTKWSDSIPSHAIKKPQEKL